MMHKNRAHVRVVIRSAGELAEKLTQHTWTPCSGFRYGDHLYLNDSTSADGAQEYAVFRAEPDENGEHEQIESITFGWMTEAEALVTITKIKDGKFGEVYAKLRLRTHEGVCAHCA